MERLLGVVPAPDPAAGAPRPAWLGGDGPDGDRPDGDRPDGDRPDGDGPGPAEGWDGAGRGHDHGGRVGGEYRAPAPGSSGGGGGEDGAPGVQQRPGAPAPAYDRSGLRQRCADLVPGRWRGTRVALGRRGAVALAGVGLLAAAAAGVGVLHDRPASVRVPQVHADPVPISGAAEAGEHSPRGADVTLRGADGAEGEEGADGSRDRGDAAAGTGGPGSADPESGRSAGDRAAAAPEEIVVSVQGLVRRSGLFRLDRGARVADALDAAGGPADGADLLSLNLAQRLSDGDQVLVGVAPDDDAAPRLRSATISAGGAAPGAADPGAGAPAGGDAGGAVDLNTAGQAELETLPGVGPVTAEAILQWRRQNGRFASVDQLTEVRGIGPATLEELRDAVTV